MEPYEHLTIPEKIENISLENKNGQMVFAAIEGIKRNKNAEQLIQNYIFGGIIFNDENITKLSKTLAYMNELKAKINHIGLRYFF
ncbi:hypothetical protein ABE096_02200 [Robertmurraya massiliosenegalensis]|uniref:hypothetical protein n=1 Tax=Robertmurraya massiliosenegalensis TaxID=1287657 RepID=UPI003D266BEB